MPEMSREQSSTSPESAIRPRFVPDSFAHAGKTPAHVAMWYKLPSEVVEFGRQARVA